MLLDEKLDVQTAQDIFERDGVVHLPQVLDQEWVDLVETGITRNLLHLGPYGRRLYEGTDREIIMDHSNFRVNPEYQILLADSPIADMVAAILGTEQLWLFFDQLWVKEPGPGRRTPWHQDTTSWIADGTHLCGFWMSLDALTAAESLEFVRGSHKGPVHAGTAFDLYDETKPYYPESGWPALPDIEADRDSWDIISFDYEPGDVIFFHPTTLHGGGAGRQRRRTLSLRFFGDDAIYAPRPGRPSPPCPGVAATLTPGDALRSSWFPRVRPRPEPAGGDAPCHAGGALTPEPGIAGRVALVTGAAGAGIGRAIARRLLDAGAHVMVSDSHAERCAAVTAELEAALPGATVAGYTLDVGDLGAIDSVVANVHERFGPIRILVNNAAVNWPGPVFDYDIDLWHRTVAVNVTGPWYICRQTMQAMREAGGGAIINIGSAAADDGGAFGTEGVYAITKGALETLTRALASDGGPYGIRVNTVSMGIVTGTRFIDRHPEQAARALPDVPLGRHPTPEDIAETVAFLASDRARSITGDIVSVNCGYAMRK